MSVTQLSVLVLKGRHVPPDGGRQSLVTTLYKHGPPDGGRRRSAQAPLLITPERNTSTP